MSLKAEIQSVLSAMGETPDAVAITLLASQIRGARNTVRFLNPIVRYLQVTIHTEAVELDLIQGHSLTCVLPTGDRETVRLPDAVHQFLNAFHAGKYASVELPDDGSRTIQGRRT